MIIHGLLSHEAPLGKSYTADGVSSYPMVRLFSSQDYGVNTPEELFSVVKGVAISRNACLLKGSLTHPLEQESRAGSTNAMTPTEWVCFDLDKVTGFNNHREFMFMLGLESLSYVVQYSSSHGLLKDGVAYDNRLSCHIFFLLAAPTSPLVLKQWLIQLNLQHEKLVKNLTLTKTGCALSYGLDITTCQNDKLLYVAPPICEAPFEDTLKERITFHKGIHDYLTMPENVNIPEQNQELTRNVINQLRELKGMPKTRKNTTSKFHGSVEYLANPGRASITGMKEERGFVYLNLNGGNSWGYYHPADNHEFIHNFKGEPVYRTKELLPDYYASLAPVIEAPKHSSETTHFIFSERTTGVYYRASQFQDEVILNEAKSLKLLSDFLAQHNLEMPEIIPEYDLVFDPDGDYLVDHEQRLINKYKGSTIEPAPGHWPNIQALINRVLGEDTLPTAPLTEQFIKWFSFVVTKKRPSKLAWLFNGVQGTGKGILFNRVLAPLIGYDHVKSVNNTVLMSDYNGWQSNCLLAMVDEVDVNSMRDAKGVGAKLKEQITEPVIAINEKYRPLTEVTNYLNWIFATNHRGALHIEATDRRHNFGHYQPKKWMPTDEELSQLDNELPAFLDHLLSLDVSQSEAMRLIDSESRQISIELSATDTALVCDALVEGDWAYIEGLLISEADLGLADPLEARQHERARSVLNEILARTTNSATRATRDELHTMLKALLPNITESKSGLTRLLKRHGLQMKQLRVAGKNAQGLELRVQDQTEPCPQGEIA